MILPSFNKENAISNDVADEVHRYLYVTFFHDESNFSTLIGELLNVAHIYTQYSLWFFISFFLLQGDDKKKTETEDEEDDDDDESKALFGAAPLKPLPVPVHAIKRTYLSVVAVYHYV